MGGGAERDPPPQEGTLGWKQGLHLHVEKLREVEP